MLCVLGSTIVAAVLASACSSAGSSEEFSDSSGLLQHKVVTSTLEERWDEQIFAATERASEEIEEAKVKIAQASTQLTVADEAKTEVAQNTNKAEEESHIAADRAKERAKVVPSVLDAKHKLADAERAQFQAADVSITSATNKTLIASEAAVSNIHLQEGQAEYDKAELEKRTLEAVQETMDGAKNRSKWLIDAAVTEADKLRTIAAKERKKMEQDSVTAFIDAEKKIKAAVAETKKTAENAQDDLQDSKDKLKASEKEVRQKSEQFASSAQAALEGAVSKLKEDEKKAKKQVRDLVHKVDEVEDKEKKLVAHLETKAKAQLKVAEHDINQNEKMVKDLATVVLTEGQTHLKTIKKSKEMVEQTIGHGLKNLEDLIHQTQLAAADATNASVAAQEASQAASSSESASAANSEKVQEMEGELEEGVKKVKELVTALKTTVEEAEAHTGAMRKGHWDWDYLFNDRNPLEPDAWKGHPDVLKANGVLPEAPANNSTDSPDAKKSSAPKGACGFGWVSAALIIASAFLK